MLQPLATPAPRHAKKRACVDDRVLAVLLPTYAIDARTAAAACASPVLKTVLLSGLPDRSSHVAPPDGTESIQPQNKAGQPLRTPTARGRSAQRRGTVPHDAERCLRRARALQSLFQTGAERDGKRRQRLPHHAPRRGRPRRRGRGAGAAPPRDGRHAEARDRGRRRQAAAAVAGARPLAVAVPVSLARAAAGPLAVSGPAPRPAAPRRRRPARAPS